MLLKNGITFILLCFSMVSMAAADIDTNKLFDRSRLKIPKAEVQGAVEEYGSNPDLEWVLKIIPEQRKQFAGEKLQEIFDYDWHTANDAARMYGYDREQGKWTYVMMGDGTELYDSLEFGISLIYEGEQEIKAEMLLKYVNSIKEKLKLLPFKTTVTEATPVAGAVKIANTIRNYKNQFNHDFIVVLRSSTAYRGSEVLAVFEKMGLEFGDGDYFHWYNRDASGNFNEYGNEALCTIFTTTDPGYFSPDAMSEDEFNPDDLVFSFVIPRSPDPENVAEAVLDAVKYLQSKWGGQLLNAYQKPFNETEERNRLRDLVKKMKAEGFYPGSNRCLQIF